MAAFVTIKPLSGIRQHKFIALLDGGTASAYFVGCHLGGDTLCLGWRIAGLFFGDGPAFRIVMFQILLARNPPNDHRLGDEKFFGPDRKIDVNCDQSDKPDACEPVQYVHPSPGHIAEEIWIASEEWRLHALHHE